LDFDEERESDLHELDLEQLDEIISSESVKSMEQIAKDVKDRQNKPTIAI
jgi:hypothetical protein